jgi:hypothetical protein
MPDQEAPRFPALYQYTSLDGLLAIARTKTLRLSHVLYQNDSSEYYHGLKLIKEVAEELSPSHIAIGVAHELMMNMSWIDVFTASFTTEPDLLSQWRGYCPNGGCSYSLLDDVLSGTLHESLTLSECIYEESKQRTYIKNALHFYTNPNGMSLGVSKFIHMLRPLVANMAAILKNEKFKEEAEWRIMTTKGHDYTRPGNMGLLSAPPYERAYQDIEFRAGKSTLIPYVTVPLGRTILRRDEGKPIPGQLFKEVYVSPGPNSELSKNACKMFLGAGCEVKTSEIPYKNW